MDEADPLRLQIPIRQGAEDLGEPFGKVDAVQDAAVVEKGGGREGKISESEGEFLPGQGTLRLRADASRPGRAEGGIGNHPLELPFREELGGPPAVTLDYGTATFETVALHVFLCHAGKFRLQFDSPHLQGRPSTGEEKGDDAAAGAEIDHVLPEAGSYEGSEKKGIDAVAVPSLRLSNGEAAYFFNSFTLSNVGRVLSGGRSRSQRPSQYLPGRGAASLPSGASPKREST